MTRRVKTRQRYLSKAYREYTEPLVLVNIFNEALFRHHNAMYRHQEYRKLTIAALGADAVAAYKAEFNAELKEPVLPKHWVPIPYTGSRDDQRYRDALAAFLKTKDGKLYCTQLRA